MYTEPTEFTNFKDRSGELHGAILRIYDGSAYWFFGNVEMDIANNEAGDTSTYHVYPLFDFDSVVESVDFLRKTWAMVRLSVTLHDLPHRIDDSGNWIRPHDDLTDAVKGSEVNLYLVAGPNVDSLDDCLLRFHGIIAGGIVLNEEKLTFTCADRSRLYRVFLPPYTVESSGLWPSCPETSRDRRIPILYGTFDQDFLSPATHNGLVRGVMVQETPPKWVFGITESNVRIYIGTASRSNVYFEGDNVTFATTGGYTTAQQDAVDGIYRASMTLDLNETVEATLFYNRTDYPVVNPANAHDGTTAVATLQDNYSDNGTIMRGVAAWGIDNNDLILTMISDETASIRILCEFRNINLAVDSGVAVTDMNLGLMYGPTEGDQHITTFPIFVSQLGNSSWDYTIPLIAADYAEDLFANDIHVMFNLQTDSGGDGSTDNQNLCTIDELRVKLETNIKRWTDAWFEGIAFGDAGDHHAPNIIKDILETYCGVESKYIISANFSDAKRTAYGPMRVCLNSANAGYSDMIIRNIIEQSNISFFWNARSEPKCVHIFRYGAETVTINATITYADIIEQSIKLSKSNFSIDQLIVYSRWQEEFGRFRDEDTYNGPGTGTGSMEVRWKFVNGTAISNLGTSYVYADNALWAFDRTIVELEAKGFKYASLEIGDLIELDHNTFDPRLKAFTESWEDKILIVIGLTQREDSTQIKAMETSFVET